MNNLNHEIIIKLDSLNLTIATCEQITGGLVSNNLVQVEESNRVFKGGLVINSDVNAIKLAKVDQDLINQYGLISPQVAKAMANGCQRIFNSDIAIATIGDVQKQKAFVCIKMFDKTYDFVFTSQFNKRSDIINECCAFTLFNVSQLVKDLKK